MPKIMTHGQPKYWDGHDVVTGAPILISAKVPIDSLCGTYKWVCNWDDMVGLVTYPTDEYSRGSLTLSLKPNSETTAANIGGSLHLWDQKGHFTSLTQPDDSYNFWRIEQFQWVPLSESAMAKRGGNLQDEEADHGFSVLDILDDNGSPFIHFSLNGGFSGGGQMFASFLGKKEKDGDPDVRGAEKLSEAERQRLNWDMDVEELERQHENQAGSEAEED